MADPSPLRAPHEAYQSRLSAARVALLALDRKGALLANLRAATFLSAALAAGLTLYGKLPTQGWALAGGLFALYGVVAYVHHHVILKEEHQKVLVCLCERGIARLTGGWHAFPERGDRFAQPEHLYLPDLDVFGQGSLFQLIVSLDS